MTQKNVLILHTDQQRFDCLGCVGRRANVRTPNLDRLASQGALFSRHIASNPVCMPSRASLMTGLYPPGHNVWSNGIALNRKVYALATPAPRYDLDVTPEPPTMADVFAGAGYDTVSFGKLHLTPNLAPPSYGYHETWSLWEEGALDDWHGPYYGFRYVDMTEGHGEHPCRGGHYGIWLQREHPEVYRRVIKASEQGTRTLPVPALGDLYPSPIPAQLHHSAWLADRLCAYLAEDRPPDRPFFAFVGFPDPHHPFTPCHDTISLFEKLEVQDPFDPEGEGIAGSPVRDRMGMDIAHLSAADRHTVIRYTYAMIYQIDQAVGRILDALQANGLWEDTIIVFTSDHGDFLGDHARLRKNTVGSDALLHLPFILRAPGADLPARVETPMSNSDVLPTLCALTGVAPPAWQHGEDICSVVREGREHHALAFCANGDPANVNYSVYDRAYRLTVYPYQGYVELYDHRTDPGECVNVAARESDRVATLMEVLQESLLRCYNPILGRTCAW
jgi:arylsulfatase A-like enzyme